MFPEMENIPSAGVILPAAGVGGGGNDANFRLILVS